MKNTATDILKIVYLLVIGRTGMKACVSETSELLAAMDSIVVLIAFVWVLILATRVAGRP